MKAARFVWLSSAMNDSSDEGPVTLVRQTEKAILVRHHANDEEAWYPKKGVHDDSEVYGGTQKIGTEGRLVLEQWFVDKQIEEKKR